MKGRGKMILGILVGLVLLIVIVLTVTRQKDFVIENVPRIIVTSPAFADGGAIPEEYSGNGKDISPELQLSRLDKTAVSLAVIMDDIDHPLVGVYNHWLIWNLPISESIPAEIPEGEQVAQLNNAVQGVGYGKHCYRGPKPPFGSHRYKYHVFVLDKKLDLPASAKKKDLLAMMEGHMVQYGYLVGEYAAK